MFCFFTFLGKFNTEIISFSVILILFFTFFSPLVLSWLVELEKIECLFSLFGLSLELKSVETDFLLLKNPLIFLILYW